MMMRPMDPRAFMVDPRGAMQAGLPRPNQPFM